MRHYELGLLFLGLMFYGVFAAPKMFCVYGSWAARQTGEGKFTMKMIQPELCDYIIYAYAELSPGGGLVVSDDPEREYKTRTGTYAHLRLLKEKNPHIKTLIGLGGHRVPATKFSRVSAVPRIREGIAIGAAEYAKVHGFDGVALAWFYPGMANRVHDKMNLSHLVRVMGNRLHNYGLELGVFVSPIKDELDKGYNLEDLGKIADYVFALTFDYHGPWEHSVRHFAPLLGEAASPEKLMSVRETISILKYNYVPAHKIVMGIATFGRTYKLLDTTRYSIGSPAAGPGNPGPITKEPGFLGYNELCKKLVISPILEETTRTTVEGPYTIHNDQWIAFENDNSVKRKVKYAKDHKLAGVFLWTLDTDDFKNDCRLGAFPLHFAANQALGKNLSRYIYV